jgi:Ca2+-binding EF-hand superfamily protein
MMTRQNPVPKPKKLWKNRFQKKIEHPSTSIEFQGLRDLPKPLQFEVSSQIGQNLMNRSNELLDLTAFSS